MLLKQLGASSCETAAGAQVRIVTVLVPTLAWRFRQEFNPRLENHHSNVGHSKAIHGWFQSLCQQLMRNHSTQRCVACHVEDTLLKQYQWTVGPELWHPRGCEVVDDILDFIATEEDTDNVVDHQMGNRAHDMWDDVTMGTFKPWMISPLGHDMH